MRHPPDNTCSHEYEVKKLHINGATVDSVVFYLRAGEPVRINLEDVLKKIGLWAEPTTPNEEMDPYLIFEVQPDDNGGTPEVYLSRFVAELKEPTL